MNKKNKNDIKEIIVNFSCGLLAGTIDVLLYFFFQSFNAGKYGYGSIAVRKGVEDSISEVESLGIDGETIKKAISKAIHRNLLVRGSDKKTIKITNEGLGRLKEIVPSYNKNRIWDGHFYLVTYDIVEEKRRQRRLLREYLKKLGCGSLQDSVWITPYNPKSFLKTFIQENFLSGSIVVSDIGKDGSIGDETLGELAGRVYQLDKVNSRYENFIVGHQKNKFVNAQTYFQFLSILKEDPQLPFEILPSNWLGDKAYNLIFGKFSSHLPVLSDSKMGKE